jgi:hypothetical protein
VRSQRFHGAIDIDDEAADIAECCAGLADQFDAGRDLGRRLPDQFLDLPGGLGGALRKFAYLLGNDGCARRPVDGIVSAARPICSWTPSLFLRSRVIPLGLKRSSC